MQHRVAFHSPNILSCNSDELTNTRKNMTTVTASTECFCVRVSVFKFDEGSLQGSRADQRGFFQICVPSSLLILPRVFWKL